jgi:flagellar motor switch protein FliM
MEFKDSSDASQGDLCALPTRQLDMVREIQEQFLAAFAEKLADRLETPIACRLSIAAPVSREAFTQSVGDGGHLIRLTAAPRAEALVAVSPGLNAYLLRRLLGAPTGASDEYRGLTDIELHILEELFELLAMELTNAWKATGIAFRLASPASPEGDAWRGAMLLFACELSFNDAQETFRIALPSFLARLAALQLASIKSADTPAPMRETILHALRRAKIDVEAVLSGSKMTMGDLLAMEPGHILMLTQTAGSPVECRIGGKPKFHGEWISDGDRQALQLQ